MKAKLFEKCLFENYKGWVNKAKNAKPADERMTIWIIVIQFEEMLNKFFVNELGYSMDRLSGNMGRNIYESITDILRGIIK